MLYRNAVVATKHDTTDEPEGVADAVMVAIAGNVSMVTETGEVLTFTAPPVGTIIPVRTKRINSTGSTATVVMLYAARSY